MFRDYTVLYRKTKVLIRLCTTAADLCLLHMQKAGVFIAPAFSKVRYRGSTFRPFVRPFVRPSVHNLRQV